MPSSRFDCPRCQTVFVKDVGGDAAFVECPSCGALALPAGDASEGAFSQVLSGTHAGLAPGADASSAPSTEGDQPSEPSAPPAMHGLFSALLDAAAEPSAPAATATPATVRSAASVRGSVRAVEFDFDFGSLELDLSTLSLPAGTRTSRGTSANDVGASFAPPAAAPPPAVHALSASAMAALAAEATTGPTNPRGAPWGKNSLSDEAFGELEQAFDEMALRPQPTRKREDHSGGRSQPPLRRGGRAEGERSEPTDRPQAPPSLPRKRTVAASSRGGLRLRLSDEAKRLAFLPLVSEASSSMLRRRAARSDTLAQSAASRVGGESSDILGLAPKARDRKPVPSAFHGLSVARALATVIVAGLLGGVGGAWTAPPAKAASTPRARAELRFADGNRFYDVQRFDDALGAFRGAINIDPTLAMAYRATGAALAQLNRHDEAAIAYEKYLELEPAAIDAADVKTALRRREGKPSP